MSGNTVAVGGDLPPMRRDIDSGLGIIPVTVFCVCDRYDHPRSDALLSRRVVRY
ncbi:MAG: hypothetical protein KGY43_08565 [Halodesulfurarchaeum sp.]|nr:hypothetical protein [Halodesulfurarchaeum sp.]